jgi:hypothetical protein
MSRIGRGLLRLWLVMSIVWICAVGMVAWSTLTPAVADLPDAPWVKPTSGKPPFDPSKPYRALTPDEFEQFDPVKFEAFKRWAEIKTGIEVAFVPPLLLLMLGAALIWVIRGFRAHDVGR